MANPDQPRGPDGRWISRRGGSFLAAVALAVTLGSGPGVTGASGLSSGSSGAARAQSTASSKARARDRAVIRTLVRLERRGLRVEQRQVSTEDDCAANSYGQVQDFFEEHPCTKLFRALYEVQDRRHNTVLVAVASVDMSDVEQAHALQRLVDSPGTGNITELSRRDGRYRPVRFGGKFYRYESLRIDTTVINAQAQPTTRTKAALALAVLAVEAIDASRP